MHRTTKLQLTDLNPHLMCALCGGYFVDAATITECLHSFCKTCIVRYLESSKYCPICDVMVHKTRPLVNVRLDKTLQDLVYKLVPGLFKNEMKRRRDFFAVNPLPDPSFGLSNEDKGEVDEGAIYTEDDKISLSLEYRDTSAFKNNPAPEGEDGKQTVQDHDKRHLLCPAAFTVAHLKKFIFMKFDLSLNYDVDIFHSDEPLNDDYTLMDVAYIYTWTRREPLKLYYLIFEREIVRNQDTEHTTDAVPHKKRRIEGDKAKDEESDLSTAPQGPKTPSAIDTETVPVLDNDKTIPAQRSATDSLPLPQVNVATVDEPPAVPESGHNNNNNNGVVLETVATETVPVSASSNTLPTPVNIASASASANNASAKNGASPIESNYQQNHDYILQQKQHQQEKMQQKFQSEHREIQRVQEDQRQFGSEQGPAQLEKEDSWQRQQQAAQQIYDFQNQSTPEQEQMSYEKPTQNAQQHDQFRHQGQQITKQTPRQQQPQELHNNQQHQTHQRQHTPQLKVPQIPLSQIGAKKQHGSLMSNKPDPTKVLGRKKPRQRRQKQWPEAPQWQQPPASPFQPQGLHIPDQQRQPFVQPINFQAAIANGNYGIIYFPQTSFKNLASSHSTQAAVLAAGGQPGAMTIPTIMPAPMAADVTGAGIKTSPENYAAHTDSAEYMEAQDLSTLRSASVEAECTVTSTQDGEGKVGHSPKSEKQDVVSTTRTPSPPQIDQSKSSLQPTSPQSQPLNCSRKGNGSMSKSARVNGIADALASKHLNSGKPGDPYMECSPSNGQISPAGPVFRV
ncbi:uncharacterized protein LOC106157411 isoform X2 [Lingula anatina]|nr:uncharacterized protein LOC106157411 isoform X2 [Lingula anatina]|eukprot:XP_013388506.1 uncharacterized protein LOC106157411 isoform X2 [Lingula anatina]